MSPAWTASRTKPVVTINNLPDEVLLEIFSYLPLDDMARSALACERWHALLKGEKELWRRKEWRSGNVAATQRFLSFSAGIPQLRSLQLLFDSAYGICVAWPNATVHLFFGTPLRWEPYFRSFDTESLVVSIIVAEQISSYIQCTNTRTLRRICITEQDFVYRLPFSGPYFTFVPTSPHYRCPVRRRTCPELAHSEAQCYPLDDPVPGGESGYEPEGAVDPEAGADGCVTCPSLEILNVHCRRVSDKCLTELCALGPLRVVRIESRGLRDLWALRPLGPHLQQLVVSDCTGMAPWDFSELRGLTELRMLRLGKCRLEEAELRDLTAGMHHLRSLSLNGRELLTCNN